MSHAHTWERVYPKDAYRCKECKIEITGMDLHTLRPRRTSSPPPQDSTLVEQRAKIDVRTNILRASIGLNTGLLAGLLVHFLANCR